MRKLTTVKALSSRLNVTRQTIWRWRKEGIIEYDNVGKKILLRPATVKRLGLK